MHLEMNPLSLVAYPFFLFAACYAIRMTGRSSKIFAPWWRGCIAFLVDFITILSLISVPLCLLGLIIENSAYPKVWFIARELNPNENLLYSAVLLPSILLTIALVGLCLHPKIVSPGALLTNVSVTTKAELPTKKLAMYGFISYFFVAFPFFKHLLIRRKDKEQLAPLLELRNGNALIVDVK